MKIAQIVRHGNFGDDTQRHSKNARNYFWLMHSIILFDILIPFLRRCFWTHTFFGIISTRRFVPSAFVFSVEKCRTETNKQTNKQTKDREKKRNNKCTKWKWQITWMLSSCSTILLVSSENAIAADQVAILIFISEHDFSGKTK